MKKSAIAKHNRKRAVPPPFAETNLALRKLGAPLLDLQMWCWGCDVRRQEGNLLTAYGLTRLPSPEPRYRSAYTCGLCENCRLTLWAWGLWLADPQFGSLYLSRSRFQIRTSGTAHPQPNAWNENALPATAAPQTEAEWHASFQLFAAVCAWVGAYEQWVTAATERGYREAAAASWPQRRCYPQFTAQAGEPVGAWSQLSALLSTPAARSA